MCDRADRRLLAEEREIDPTKAMRKDLITVEFLTGCFDYRDGKLFWKYRPLSHFPDSLRMNLFNSRYAGKEAGSPWRGYRMIATNLGRISTHRAIFMMHHGYLPQEVDHINGDSEDNRIENLRAATHQQNSMNMRTNAGNTSGRKGVFKLKGRERWVAYVRKDGRNRYSPRFSSFDEAVEFRGLIEKMVYGEFANAR